jgi:uncharacterized membrane protein YhhN
MTLLRKCHIHGWACLLTIPNLKFFIGAFFVSHIILIYLHLFCERLHAALRRVKRVYSVQSHFLSFRNPAPHWLS